MRTISARQLARSVGVSESSIKRWSDDGKIAFTKTVGGHRRFSLDVATQFMKEHNEKARPEILGLPSRIKLAGSQVSHTIDRLYNAIIVGNEELCRRILFELHISGMRISRICDLIIAPVFWRVGQRWECHDLEVYQERRACELCLRIVNELRALIPVQLNKAPLAIGATLEGDAYSIPNTIAEIVLRQSDWRAESIGTQLPFATLAKAINDLKPKLFWLSVSTIADEKKFLDEYSQFYSQVSVNVPVVVGGRALHDSIRRQISYSSYCDNMQHLEEFAKTLIPKNARVNRTK